MERLFSNGTAAQKIQAGISGLHIGSRFIMADLNLINVPNAEAAKQGKSMPCLASLGRDYSGGAVGFRKDFDPRDPESIVDYRASAKPLPCDNCLLASPRASKYACILYKASSLGKR